MKDRLQIGRAEAGRAFILAAVLGSLLIIAPGPAVAQVAPCEPLFSTSRVCQRARC